MRLSVCNLLLFGLLISEISYSVPTVGLSPSVAALGQAESLVASSYGVDSLFYNPANLAWQGAHLGLLSGAARVDQGTINSVDDFLDKEAESSVIKNFFEGVQEQDRAYGASTFRVLELSIPFLSATSFTQLEFDYSRSDSETRLLDVESNTGAIGGLAIKLSPRLSVGVSYYKLARAQLKFSPNQQQYDEIVLSTQEEFDEMDVAPFTDAKIGYAEGYNGGLSWRFWDENPSGIAMSILNIGGTSFEKDPTSVKSDLLNKGDEQARKFLEKHNITAEIPAGIPQIVNVGLSLGVGSIESSFHARLNAEKQDVMGYYLEHKNTASFSLGFQLPPTLALLTAGPIAPGKDTWFHGGILGLRVFGGVRQDVSQSAGGQLSLHFGQEKKISILRIDLNYFFSRKMNSESAHVEMQGARMLIAATLLVLGF